jgi:hypothetical protein
VIEERSDFFLSLYESLGPLGARPGALELSLEFCDALGRCRFGGLRRLRLRRIGRRATAPGSS